MRGSTMVLVILLVVVLVAGVVYGRGIMAQLDRKEQEVSRLAEENKKLKGQLALVETETGQARVALYFVKETPTEFYLSPEVRTIKREENMPAAALRELVAGPTDPTLQPILPKNVRVLGVTVRGGVAYPDFSSEILRLNVGSRLEGLTVAAIVDTLAKFPDVHRVKIVVEGKEVETLAGHVGVNEILTPDFTSVRY